MRPTSRSRRVLAKLLVVAGAAVVALFSLRLFVGDVYRVETRSMRPTILAGEGEREWVLVRHGAPEPLARHELVVVRDDASGEALVKRLVGLPGETLQLVDGDLLVEGARLPLSAPRPPPILVFDSDVRALADEFLARTTPPAIWELGARDARLRASSVPRGADAGLAFFRRPLLDDHLGADGERVVGTRHVGDAVLDLVVELLAVHDPSAAEVRLRLVEQGDTFEALLEPSSSNGPGRARLVRRPGHAGQPHDVLADAPLDLAVGAPLAIAFSNVDDQLALDVGPPGGERTRLLLARYDQNRPYAGAPSTDGHAIGPRAAFGGSGFDARFEHVRIGRDTSWIAQGRFGLAGPLTLGADEVFVLGDDSAHSRDSRQFGPLRKAAVTGRPVAVVWPLSRLRRLVGVVEPPPPAR